MHPEMNRVYREYLAARFELAGAFLAAGAALDDERQLDMALELAAGSDAPDQDALLARQIRDHMPEGDERLDTDLVVGLQGALTRFDQALRMVWDFEQGRHEAAPQDRLAPEEKAEFVTVASAFLAADERMEMTRKPISQTLTATGAVATCYEDGSDYVRQISDRLTQVIATLYHRHPIDPGHPLSGIHFPAQPNQWLSNRILCHAGTGHC